MPDKPFPGILSTVGNTPLVELEKLLPDFGSRVFGKVERFNPGGSIKDRSALGMLREAIRSGEVEPGRSVIVESSSGNLAVGLAQICRYYGLRFVCVVDAKTTEQNLAILRAFSAEVEVVTERDELTGEYLPVRLRRVRELVASIDGAYWPNQYASLLNPKAHETTMREIEEALDGKVDYLFCSVSTFGTLRGCRDHIRARGLDTTIVAVDAQGSAIFGLESTQRLIPGHGASVVPPLMDASAADEVVHISDLECVVACRRLIAREAVLAGGSSGATVAALWKFKDRVPRGSHCVLVFPDGGDRYLDTIYSDNWVSRNFGDVAHLWKD
ncbi:MULTISPECIES: 2,3-diaminopropionate biosynthesis protein SbnA [unclassified Streptomyces]|uniref:2,3-diaminopropionate biosynthesis protein SbnA n=1 Tax=unclassified Streptomyces TaxID=2593676 RepID=UPI0035E0B4CC